MFLVLSIGWGACARRVINASSCTSTICPRCPNATSTQDSVSDPCLNVIITPSRAPDACHNKECPFLHIDPEAKVRDCPWYDRGILALYELIDTKYIPFPGFCRHGPNCRHRHVRRVLCINYLAGFCPLGPKCTDAHPRFELPGPADMDPKMGKKVLSSPLIPFSILLMTRLWSPATIVERSGTRCLIATKCLRFPFLSFVASLCRFLFNPCLMITKSFFRNWKTNKWTS